jgi:hypothetical protein
LIERKTIRVATGTALAFAAEVVLAVEVVLAGESTTEPSGDAPEAPVPVQVSAQSSAVLNSPLPVPRLSFFHAALEVPPLDTASTLSPGAFYLRAESSHARSVDRQTIDGVESRFDGLYHDWVAFKLAAGVLPRLEAFTRVALAGWDETLDKFTLLDSNGDAIVENEAGVVLMESASNRHDNVSDVVAGAKVQLARVDEIGFDFALAASVKIPVSRPTDLTNAGTTDLNFTLLATRDLGPVTVHLNLGGGIPFGNQNLFVDSANVDLNAFIHGGAAIAWPVLENLTLVAQLEANTTAFRDVEFLDGPPVTVLGGLRQRFGRFFLEAGGGTGLTPHASYDYAIYVSIGWLIGR